VVPSGLHPFAVLFALVAFLCLGGTSARGAGLIGGSYTLNWDSRVDKKDTGTINANTLKQVAEIKYKGFLRPVVENELTLKVEHERTEEGENLLRLSPIVSLGYKGTYWNAGTKRTVEDSNEAGKEPRTSDAHFVEFLFSPPRKTLPDLKAKYNLDKDYEKGTSDTSKHAFTASSIYRPMEWIEFKGEYTLNRSYDYLQADSDTRDDKRSATVGIRHIVSKNIKFNTEYKAEVVRGATLLDAGGTTGDKKDHTHTWKNTLAFRPFRETNIDASYDFDLKQSMVTGEHTFTENYKAAVTQKVAIFDLKGDFTRVVTEPRHTADDNRKTDDAWTAELRWKFAKQLDFSLKYQVKEIDEVFFADPSKDTTSGSNILGGTWNGELAPFWKASASFERTDTFAKEVKTTVDLKNTLKSTFDFKAINLTLEPSYDITRKEDLVKSPVEVTDLRDFKFRLWHKVLTSRNIDATFDHTYGRKVNKVSTLPPEDPANHIERTDSTTGNVSWKEPLPGWIFMFDLTRAASDTSNDDNPPQVDSSFGVKGDYKMDQFTMATSFKYDMKRTTADVETFDLKLGWLAPRWDASMIYTFTKTLSEELNETYSIAIAFKYTL